MTIFNPTLIVVNEINESVTYKFTYSNLNLRPDQKVIDFNFSRTKKKDSKFDRDGFQTFRYL